MIINAFIIAFLTVFVYESTQPDMILQRVSTWVAKRVNDFWFQPIFGCPICMAPWWGMIIFYPALYVFQCPGFETYHFGRALITTFIAGGIVAVFVWLTHEPEDYFDDDDDDDREDVPTVPPERSDVRSARRPFLIHDEETIRNAA
jgi:hypothetical protein